MRHGYMRWCAPLLVEEKKKTLPMSIILSYDTTATQTGIPSSQLFLAAICEAALWQRLQIAVLFG